MKNLRTNLKPEFQSVNKNFSFQGHPPFFSNNLPILTTPPFLWENSEPPSGFSTIKRRKTLREIKKSEQDVAEFQTILCHQCKEIHFLETAIF